MIAYPPARRTGDDLSPQQRPTEVAAPDPAEVAPAVVSDPARRGVLPALVKDAARVLTPWAVVVAVWCWNEWAGAVFGIVWLAYRAVTTPRRRAASSRELARVERSPRRRP